MKAVLFVVGVLAGVVIVRAQFLDPFQVMGWDMFWNGLSEGELFDIELVLESKTFLKCAVGAGVGGLLGMLLGSVFQKAKSDSKSDSNEDDVE